MKKSWKTRWAETVVFGLVTLSVGGALGGRWYLAGYIIGILLGIAVAGLIAERWLHELRDEINRELDETRREATRVREQITWTPRQRHGSS